jgi:hypothetical protein
LSGEILQVMFVFPVSFLDVGITSLFHLFVESLLTSYLLFKDAHRMSDADYPIVSDFKFTSNGIEKLLKGLNAHKAPGPGNLSPILLKGLSSEITPLLQLVYQKSLDTSCVPEDWRKANVTPIYKKGLKYPFSLSDGAPELSFLRCLM